MARTATIGRRTYETQISLRLNLDGRGKSDISTGIPFFDHILDLFGFSFRLGALAVRYWRCDSFSDSFF